MDRLEQLKWFEAKSASRSAKFSRKYSSKGLTLKMIFGIFTLLIFHIFPVQAHNNNFDIKCGSGNIPLDVLLAYQKLGTYVQGPPVSQLGPSELGPPSAAQLGPSELDYPSPAYAQSFVQPTPQPVELVKHDPNSTGGITSLALMFVFYGYFKTAFAFLKNLTAFNTYIDGILTKGAAGILPKEFIAFISLFGRFLPLGNLFCTPKTDKCKFTRTGPNDITLNVTYGGKRRSTLRRRAR